MIFVCNEIGFKHFSAIIFNHRDEETSREYTLDEAVETASELSIAFNRSFLS